MKLLKLILFAPAVLLSLVMQAQHQSASQLLKDKTMQDSVMTAIAADHDMAMNMMHHLMQNKQAMEMMAQHTTMMKDMMNSAAKDSAQCRAMMNMMMENKEMHGMMMQMMKQEKSKEVPKKGKPKDDHAAHH